MSHNDFNCIFWVNDYIEASVYEVKNRISVEYIVKREDYGLQKTVSRRIRKNGKKV